MPVPLLDLGAQHETIRDEIEAALQAVIARQGFIMGPEVQALEAAIATAVEVPHAVACASGTDALLLPLRTLELEPGDEVITPSFTFFATAGTIHNAGGTPVFADIDPDTFIISPEEIEARITPRTRAIMVVHLFGQMAPMERIMAIASQHGLPVIEDGAQSIGARRRIDSVWCTPGQLGLAASLSFFPSKNLGCWGDGGMILTTDAALAARLARLRLHGGAKQYHHEEVGFNSRLDTLQAAILLVKLRHLSEWTRARQAHAERYHAAFRGLDGVIPPHVDGGNEHVWHQYTLRAERRDGLMTHLKERGIGCAVYYPRALHLQPCFAHLGAAAGSLPITEAAMASVLSLPIYPELSQHQQDEVIEAVREFTT